MEYRKYITRSRARFKAIGRAAVNLPYGTEVACEGGFLVLDDRRLCAAASKISHDFFCQNDDGRGQERGGLVTAILASLRPGNETRWDKVWESQLCQRYRRQEHDDYWLWSHDFYNAPVDDLRQIAALVGGWDK